MRLDHGPTSVAVIQSAQAVGLKLEGMGNSCFGKMVKSGSRWGNSSRPLGSDQGARICR